MIQINGEISVASILRENVIQGFNRAWNLKFRFLISHVALSLLAIAIITPVTALILRTAIGFSGNPALADQDIAYFLLSPLGLVCFLVVASILITVAVLDMAFLMSIHLADLASGRGGFRTGLGSVLPRLPAIFNLAARLIVRVLLIAGPFLLVAFIVASRNLAEYDINYYLSEHPAEFIRSVVLIGLILLILAIVLIDRLLTWALTLPAVLYGGISPAQAFGYSNSLVKGRKSRLLRVLALWALASLTIGAVLLGAAGLVARLVVPYAGGNLTALVVLLSLVGLLWLLANTIVTTLTSGCFAVLICEEFRLAGGATDPHYLTSTENLPVLLRRLAVLGPIAGIAILAGSISGQFLLKGIKTNDSVIVIAHRGAAGSKPENTLAAVSKAVEDGADYIEIDVQESADGEVIVVHDSDFMKLAGVNLKVWDATAAQLADIDIGSWFDPTYAAERTPTLAQVLQLTKNKSKVLIELKYYGHDVMLEQRVLDIVAEQGMEDQVAYMSLKLDAVEKTKQLAPEVSAGLLAATAIGDITGLNADFLAVNIGLARRSLIRRADDVGKPVFVWTVNDPLKMSQMISRGVDGLITDEPALALEVIAAHAELTAPERLMIALSDMLGISLNEKTYRDGSP